jgi:molecular chaperone GrpE
MTGTPSRTEAEQPADGGHPPPPSGQVAGNSSSRPVEATAEGISDDRLLRALADLDNLRKRFQREVTREREAERSRVASEWLPVVESLPEGLRVVRQHALDVLARLGYLRFGEEGDRFDPARYEAVGAVDADTEPGTVLAVVRPGYGTPEVILRPAAVVVAKGAP